MPRSEQPGPSDAAVGPRGAGPAALSVDGITVRYRNGAVGVDDVSFAVEEGEVIALLGPNGAGKTTCVRAAGGFLRSERTRVIRGRVAVFGRNIVGLEPHRVSAMGVAVVPERVKVFPALSVADNLVALGGLPRRGTARTAAVERVLDLFPVLGERQRQPAGRLSGGQQQMLAIARALIREPRVLLIDELTLGLHHSLHGPLFEAVERIARTGTAVVIVDESAGFALEAADRCYVLSGGRVRDEGPASRFRDDTLLAAGYV